ncbi:MAG: AMP-binding protein [Spirochaetales bacterium]|jgi:long-chain acyl-CoA synthetase|nr:AMP-binding protein [Spirochaetales bacterium]
MADSGDTLAKRFKDAAEKYPTNIAQLGKDENEEFIPTTFRDMYDSVIQLASLLDNLGVSRGDHVGLISDNRTEWLISDLALLCLGAVDVPRGSDSTADELVYILDHADCKISFVENDAQIEKILSEKANLPQLELLISFEPHDVKSSDGVKILCLSDMLEDAILSPEAVDHIEKEIEKGTPEELVTIIYTSGTTGEPKGVMLNNRNYTFQLERIYDHIHITSGSRYLSVLPAWHSFERVVDYVIINIGATIAYSKPIGPILKADMLKVRPQWTAAVPRLWEGIRAGVYRNVHEAGGAKKILFNFFVAVGSAYSKLRNRAFGMAPKYRKPIWGLGFITAIIPLLLIAPLNALGQLLVFSKLKNKLLGGRFIAAISGGGALPPYVDSFFQAAGIKLLEGYGLTETGPVLSTRLQDRPVVGTVGPLLPDIESRVVGENDEVLPPGKKGVLFVKSEQIMQGYYKREEATKEVLNDGWLDTGDIVIFTHSGELKIIGRAKETVVLLGGENIEPTPIEDKLKQSDAIDQVMVVGQDQKFLAAFIVPNEEFLEQFTKERNLSYVDRQDLLDHTEVQDYYHSEIGRLVGAKTGFKAFERIFRFKLLTEEFTLGRELTHTLKVRRNVVNEKYAKELKEFFA